MSQDPGDRAASTASLQNPNPNGFPTKPESASASVRSLYDVCFDIRNKIDGFLAEDPETPLLRDVQVRLREAMGVVDEAFKRYKPQEIALSYNGGKDCLVLLIIILACFARHSSTSNTNQSAEPSNQPSSPRDLPKKFQAVYIVSPHPFSEIDDFVASSSAEYSLDVTRYELGMKQGLEVYLADRPDIKAIFVGTRRTDPHGQNLTHFDRTDGGWPDFMRVHPVIDWHYAEIWAFIRHLGISYCPLYDQGYTSLGGTEDTQPNPHLKKQDKIGGGFLPAYVLVGDDEERLGRDK